MDTTKLLEEVAQYAAKIVTDYSELIVYHDLKFAKRLIGLIEDMGEKSKMSEEDLNLAKAIGWFYSCGYYNLKVKVTKNNFISNNIETSLEAVDNFFLQKSYAKEIKDKVKVRFRT